MTTELESWALAEQLYKVRGGRCKHGFIKGLCTVPGCIAFDGQPRNKDEARRSVNGRATRYSGLVTCGRCHRRVKLTDVNAGSNGYYSCKRACAPE